MPRDAVAVRLPGHGEPPRPPEEPGKRCGPDDPFEPVDPDDPLRLRPGAPADPYEPVGPAPPPTTNGGVLPAPPASPAVPNEPAGRTNLRASLDRFVTIRSEPPASTARSCP